MGARALGVRHLQLAHGAHGRRHRALGRGVPPADRSGRGPRGIVLLDVPPLGDATRSSAATRASARSSRRSSTTTPTSASRATGIGTTGSSSPSERCLRRRSARALPRRRAAGYVVNVATFAALVAAGVKSTCLRRSSPTSSRTYSCTSGTVTSHSGSATRASGLPTLATCSWASWSSR